MPSVQGSRLLLSAHIRPPKALEPGGLQYFSNKTQTNVVKSVGDIGRALEKRIHTRIESEEFGAGSKFGHADHTGKTVKQLYVMTPAVETPALMKAKGVQLKVMLSSPVMPWPLMTEWPIGIPGSRHQAKPFYIRPRSDRKSTGTKSRRKRLYFMWRNAGKMFWGPKVRWPGKKATKGFGPDVLSQELTAAKPLLVDASRDAVQRAILDWTKGGSRQAPSTEVVRRPRTTR